MSPLLFLFAAAILTSSLLKVESFTSLRTSTTVRGPPRLSSLSAQNNVILNDLLASSGNDTAAPSSSSSLTPSSSSDSERRRNILRSALAAPLSIIATSSSLAYPQPASASTSEKPPPIVPLLTTAKRLRAVPTFTIVDGNGVPLHTYDKDSAGGFGYFFASYTSAEYVLDDARKAFAKAKTEASAKKEDEEAGGGAIDDDGSVDVPDAWGRAQIATVPLDVAMQLSVKKTQSVAQNTKGGKKFSTFYQVIPSTEDLNAALRIENGPRYSERGRVPLFYVDGLTVPSSDEEGDGGAAARANPVYFRIRDLKAEWQRQHPESELPTVKVRELNETFRAMIRPGGKDESVKNLVFVPIPESVEKSKDSGRSYKLGEMILTK